jgi:hypothetical protein
MWTISDDNAESSAIDIVHCGVCSGKLFGVAPQEREH